MLWRKIRVHRQWFNLDHNYPLADIISALEFDETGAYLATGDRGGRAVIFKDTPTGYAFFAEFQSHEPEFDYLRSVEIDEQINRIKWCKQSTSRDLFLLTTNGTFLCCGLL